jgi:DNA polymerase-3 subunit epsilon
VPDLAQLSIPVGPVLPPGTRGSTLADRLCALLVRRGRPLEVGHVVTQLLRLRGCPERLGRVMVGEIIEADARLAWHGRDLVGLAPDGWPTARLAEARFCVVDLETTGGSPGRAKVTEIAAVRVRGLEPGATFSTLVDPGRPIPPAITAITGITDEMVAGQPDIAEALPRFLDFCGDDVLVAHNAPFDLRFLNYERRRLLGTYFTQPWLDTLTLARRLLRGRVERHDLGSLARWAGTEVRPCHRALPDAQAAAELLVTLLRLLAEAGEDSLAGAVALGQWGAARHAHKLALAESLPQAPGVYLMRDRRGEVLYVGKALNLRRRVRAYFGPGGRHGRGVGRALEGLHRVDHEVCGSEFEALWREARLLREHRPPCNRVGLGDGHYLKLTVAERFPRLYAVSEPSDATALHAGPVRSRRSVRLAVEALQRLYPLRTCRWLCRDGAVHAPPAHAAPCAGPCRGDGAGYGAVVDEVRHLLEADLAEALGTLAPRLTAAAAAGRVGRADGELVEALVSVLAGIARVRRARAGAVALLEVSSTPGRVTAFFVARGQVVERCELPAAGVGPAAREGLVRARSAAGDSRPVPPGALQEVLIVARRIAERRGTPALVEIPPDRDDEEVLAALAEGVAWVLESEAPTAPGELEDVTPAA